MSARSLTFALASSTEALREDRIRNGPARFPVSLARACVRLVRLATSAASEMSRIAAACRAMLGSPSVLGMGGIPSDNQAELMSVVGLCEALGPMLERSTQEVCAVDTHQDAVDSDSDDVEIAADSERLVG